MPDEQGNSIWYRMLFTKDDDLDLTQLYFAFSVVFGFIAFAMAGSGRWTVSVAAWGFFGSMFLTLAITGTPRWVAELVAQSKAPGEVAAGITQGSQQYGPNTYDFDARDYMPRVGDDGK